MIGRIYKTIDSPTSKLLEEGIVQVTGLDSDGAVHYIYLSIKGFPHPQEGNHYAQEIQHFKKHTVQLTELDLALL